MDWSDKLLTLVAVLCMSIAGDTGYPGMKGRSGEKGDQGWLQ